MGKNYSLNLPLWGPYNKKYLGASHVADRSRGLRFDLNLFPGYFRRSVMSPRDIADCGAKMMGASGKLTRFIYRYELEWKDRVFVEADFSSDNNVLTVRCDFVNNTENPESLTLNAVMSMHGCTANHKDIIPCEVNVKDGLWVDALDYCDIKTPQTVASDGLFLCEERDSGFVGGSYIDSSGFGLAVYSFEAVSSDVLTIRYRGQGCLKLMLDGDTYRVELPCSDDVVTYPVNIKAGAHSRLEVYPQSGSVCLDGFLMGGEAEFSDCCDELSFELVEDDLIRICFGGGEYTVKTDCESYVIRRLNTDDVGQLLTGKIHDHVSSELGDGGHGYADLFLRPVFVEPNSKKTITITITAPQSEYPDIEPEHSVFEPVCNPSGERYRLSQKIMGAVTLTNVVWPIYSRRGYILHNTPGRNWDSLYTWDSGFIGIGLLQLDKDRAKECLNAYMTPVGDIHSPCIFHGTPLPTQIFLFAEIFSKTGDVEFLKELYPMVYQQHRFFADRRKTNSGKTGMFALWDLFYNSGGWDDYPTQRYVHENHLEDEVCPVINTAMTVLCAKILKGLAGIAGFDTWELDEDIEFYSDAINRWAWDEQSGYYGYVKSDGSILKIDGVNADMGMDGAFPYVAGICDGERAAVILKNIKEGMVTPLGVSVVDRRAPYYREDGYWNGSVWMPHQWILWKACLDNGEAYLAWQISETALDLWEKETSCTYNCYEHFMITNGRGAGFHQFSGLSTPVLAWFSAYFKPFTVTSGFLTVITDKKQNGNNLSFCVESSALRPVVIICMPENKVFDVKTSGKVTSHNGIYTVEFDGAVKEKIEITDRALADGRS